MNLRSGLSILILVLASPTFGQMPPEVGSSEASASAVAATQAMVPTTYKIRQVITSQNLVVAETSNPNESIAVGKVFLVTFPNEKQCPLSLKEKNGALLMLGSSECSNAQDITRSLVLELSLASAPMEAPVYKPEPTPPLESYPKADRWDATRFSVAAHYSGATDLKFDKVSVSTATGAGSGEINFGLESSLGIGVSFTSMRPQGWGYLANIFYERSRDFKTATVKGPSGATNVTEGPSSSVSFLVAEMNAVYRWNTFYMPFGLNANVPTISNSSTITYSGGVGAFWGAGFILDDNISIEIFMRSLSVFIEHKSATTTVDYGLGTLMGVGAGFKFWF